MRHYLSLMSIDTTKTLVTGSVSSQGVTCPGSGLPPLGREPVASMLKTRTAREEAIIRMRFGLNDDGECTLEEVARTFAVTRERIRQIETRVLRKLRPPSRRFRIFVRNSL